MPVGNRGDRFQSRIVERTKALKSVTYVFAFPFLPLPYNCAPSAATLPQSSATWHHVCSPRLLSEWRACEGFQLADTPVGATARA